MTPLETAIADRLHAAADRIVVDRSMPLPSAVVVARPPRRNGRFLVAAAVLAIVVAVGAGIVVVTGDGVDDRQVTAAAGPGPTRPHVADPPDWFGRPRTAMAIDERSGNWVATAIGRVTSDGVVEAPFLLTASDGYNAALGGDGGTVELDGRTFQRRRVGGWATLATMAPVGEPAVGVSGIGDDVALLAILDAVTLEQNSGGFTVTVDPAALPAGYTQLAPPRRLGPVPSPNVSIVGSDEGTAVYDSSDWLDPLLAMAGAGVDLHPVRVGDIQGWAGGTVDDLGAPLRFVTFSPEPGVVLQVVSTHRTFDELVDLARGSVALPVDEWEAIYGTLG